MADLPLPVSVGDGTYYAINDFVGDGTTTQWETRFVNDYLAKQYIYVDDWEGNPIPFAWGTGETIIINPPVEAGKRFRIFRNTPKGEPLVEFQDGAVVTQRQLNKVNRQHQHTIVEIYDRFSLTESAAAEAKDIALGVGGKASDALVTAQSANALSLEAFTVANGIDAKATQAMRDAAYANTTSQSALTVANGIDAKATQALNQAQDANSKSTQATATANLAKEFVDSVTEVVTSDDTSLDVTFPDGSLVPTVAKRIDSTSKAVKSVNGQTGDVVLDLLGRPDVSVYSLSKEGFVEGDVDNTPALAALVSKITGNTIINVDGRYQFTSGNVIKDMQGFNITFSGTGSQASALVYKRTLGNKTSYVDDDTANKIMTIQNASTIAVDSVLLEGVTSLDNPNGAITNNDAVYHGDVWGLVLDSFDTLIVRNSKVTGFNYRGISVKCSDTVRKQNGRIFVENSEFTRNKGSGMWIRYTKEVYIDGGESSYNGLLGQYGTGYGITCSLAVNYLSCKNHYFHHNYRKGLDTHGCLNVDIRNNRFVDNVCYHLALIQWGTAAAGSLFVKDEQVVIRDNYFSKGADLESRNWLDAAYAANSANGYAPNFNDINIDAVLSNGTAFGNTLSRVIFEGNVINSVYFGTTSNNANCASQFVFRVASKNTSEVILSNNKMNLNGFVTLRNSMYNASLMFATAKSVRLVGNDIRANNATLSYTTYFGTLILLQDEQGLKFSATGNSFSLPQCYLVASYSGAGAAFPAIHKIDQNGSFITENNEINFAKLPTKDFQAYAYLGRIFDTSYPNHVSYNNRVTIGGTQYAPLLYKQEPQQFTRAFKAPYGVGAIGADTDVLYVDIDPTLAFHLNVHFKSLNETVSLWKLTGTFPAGLAVNLSTNFTFSRGVVVVLPNGQEIYRLYLKTRQAINLPTSLFGSLDYVSYNGSYGVVNVQWLI